MRSLLWLSVFTLVALPGSAFARFGKAHHDGDSGSSSSSSSSSSHSSSTPSGHYHSAEAPGSRSGGNSGSYGSGYGYGYGYEAYQPHYWHPWDAWGFGYSPIWGAPAYSYPSANVQQQAIPVVTTLTMDGQALKNGAAVGAEVSLEGEQFGVTTSLHSIFVQADDGTSSIDAIHLANLHLTYALVSTPQGRLRLEGGVDSAVAPDITMIGPGVGFSGALGLVGQLSANFAVELTPYPFRQVDWRAGMTVNFGALALSGGFRQTWLDDEGRVDGIDNQDLFSGPYLGLALAL